MQGFEQASKTLTSNNLAVVNQTSKLSEDSNKVPDTSETNEENCYIVASSQETTKNDSQPKARKPKKGEASSNKGKKVVEKIIAIELCTNVLVHWKGYGASEDRWQPIKNVSHTGAVDCWSIWTWAAIKEFEKGHVWSGRTGE